MQMEALCLAAELQRRLEHLNHFMGAISEHPEWFDSAVKPAAQDWLEGEIMQLEAEQHELLEKRKQPPGGATVCATNIFNTSSVPHFREDVQV